MLTIAVYLCLLYMGEGGGGGEWGIGGLNKMCLANLNRMLY